MNLAVEVFSFRKCRSGKILAMIQIAISLNIVISLISRAVGVL